MKHHYLLFALLAVSPWSSAGNLGQYRRGILKPLATTEEMSFARLHQIRRALGTSEYPSLQVEAGPSAVRSLRSSTIVKDALQNATREIIRANRLDAPVAFNPNWSPAEYRHVLLIESRKVCLRAIQNSRLDREGHAVGIEAVLKDLYARIANGTEADPPIESNGAGSKSILAEHLRLLPLGPGGRSITQVLGEVQAVEFAGGLVDRVQFGRNDEQILLSLGTLLTHRTGQDDTFVQAQDCLYDYLKEQREIFRRQERDPAARPMAKLEFFLEGHAFANDTRAELKFIRDRLLLSNRVLSFLEARVPLAHRVSDKLNALSKREADALLDMFLQLDGKDLPSVRDGVGMGEIFAGAGVGVAADAKYYGLLGQMLTELEITLSAEQMDAVARAKDLARIRAPDSASRKGVL